MPDLVGISRKKEHPPLLYVEIETDELRLWFKFCPEKKSKEARARRISGLEIAHSGCESSQVSTRSPQ